VQKLIKDQGGPKQGFAKYNFYDMLMAEYLLKKWKIAM
jgi:hypothetical protein